MRAICTSSGSSGETRAAVVRAAKKIDIAARESASSPHGFLASRRYSWFHSRGFYGIYAAAPVLQIKLEHFRGRRADHSRRRPVPACLLSPLLR